MSKYTALNFLTELAQTHSADAGRTLRQLADTRHNAQRQLDSLREYQQDYAERLAHCLRTGSSASNYQNFQRFIATLETAIKQQNSVLDSLEHKLSDARCHWITRRHRLRAYQALLARRQQQQQLNTLRAEQGMCDEASAGLHHRRHYHEL